MGMIYKRGRIWWIKYYQNGKPYRESSRSSKEIDAKKLLRKREGEISEGKAPGVVFDRVKFDDLIGDYRNNERKSIKCVERIIRLHLSPFFDGYRVTAITTSKIRAYIAHRKNEGAKNATINRELAALKRMHNIALRSTPPKVLRTPYIPMLKENNVRVGFFEHEDYLKVRDALPDYLKGLFTFAYKTGWRKSEITGLKWDQVDLNQGIVRLEVGQTKNNNGRVVYLDQELKAVLRDNFINRQLGCDYVFHRKGRRIGDFRKAWHNALKEAGVSNKIFHDMRRSAIRSFLRAGIPEHIAMTISGHKTRSVFDRYDIIDSNDLKLAAERLDLYLRAQTEGTK